MMKGECPSEILTTEGTDVIYFKDFENDNSQVSGDNKKKHLYVKFIPQNIKAFSSILAFQKLFAYDLFY